MPVKRALHLRAICALLLALTHGCTRAGGSAEDAEAPRELGGDSAFTAMQERGHAVMGVDQYEATHHFTDLPDGGSIVLLSDTGDSTAVREIRAHLTRITGVFAADDFSDSSIVHMSVVPGAEQMKTKRDVLTYSFEPRDRGGAVRITTSDAGAILAVHEFLAFQRSAHRMHAPDTVAP